MSPQKPVLTAAVSAPVKPITTPVAAANITKPPSFSSVLPMTSKPGTVLTQSKASADSKSAFTIPVSVISQQGEYGDVAALKIAEVSIKVLFALVVSPLSHR